jgi:pSer/pThr/pTyr-binding forkhead associated (FHA) protein
MAEEEYVEIGITILESAPQRARVKRSLTVSRLIEEIFKEFDDLDHSDSSKYALFMHSNEKPLSGNFSLERLDIRNHDELEFRYARISGRRPLLTEKRIALSGEGGQIFDINWQPAVIGRPMTDPDHNQVLAVNLQSHPNGQHISRRHAQITFSDNRFYIEALSENNPVYLNKEPNPIRTRRVLAEGDQIYLGNKKVPLTVIRPRDESSLSTQQFKKTGRNDVTESATRLSFIPSRTRIVFLEGIAAGKTVEVSSYPYELGREMISTGVEDTAISRRHARIDFNDSDGTFTITDLNSRNGVMVNEERIPANEATLLPDQALVNLGQKTKFRFEIIK